MHRLLFLIASFLVILTSASAAPKEKHFAFSTPQFKELRVQDNVNVIYKVSTDSIARVSYTAPEDFADSFIFTNSGGTLKIQVTTEDVGKTDLPTLYITSNHLERVHNYSDFNITIENTGTVPAFEATLIGNGMINVNLVKADKIDARTTAGRGQIILQGECRKANFRITGSGTINAAGLAIDDLDCKILGAGSIYCPTLKTLTVKGLGSTKIYYPGNPKIKHSGGGKLIHQ